MQEAVEKDPRNVEAWYGKGLALIELKSHSQALQCFDRIIAIDGKHDKAWYAKGYVLRSLGEEVEAEKACQEAARLGNKQARDYLDKRRR